MIIPEKKKRISTNCFTFLLKKRKKNVVKRCASERVSLRGTYSQKTEVSYQSPSHGSAGPSCSKGGQLSPLDNAIGFPNNYPVDNDLSGV